MRYISLPAVAVSILALSLSAAFADGTIKLGNIVVGAGVLKGPGEPSIAAVDVAVDKINAAGGVNGKNIEIVRFDTGSDAKQASVGARKLIQDDNVLAIIGPFSSGESAVALNDAERLKTLMMPTSASAPGVTEGRQFGWRLTADEATQFGRLIKSIKSKGIKSDTAEIVYISDEVVSNSAGTKLYPELLEAAGIKHGAPIAVQYKSFDMSAQASKIVQSNPDLVALAALPESAAKVVKELRRQGYKGRVIGSQIFADPNVGELMGADGDGTMFVAGFWKNQSPEAKAFDDKLVETLTARGIHRLGAHHADAQAYDTVFLIKQLLEKTGATGDPAKLATEREALANTINGIRFNGVLGNNICFKSTHDAELPGYIIELKGGAWNKFDAGPANAC